VRELGRADLVATRSDAGFAIAGVAAVAVIRGHRR
jgi:hypothetical protein